jgi:DnaK suppressor protein
LPAAKAKPAPTAKAAGKASPGKSKAVSKGRNVIASAKPAPQKAAKPTSAVKSPAKSASQDVAKAKVADKPSKLKPDAAPAPVAKVAVEAAPRSEAPKASKPPSKSVKTAAAAKPRPEVVEAMVRPTGGVRARAIIPNRVVTINEPPPAVVPVRVDLPPGYRPGPDDEYMNPYHLEYFRHKLMSWREELVEESKQTIDNLREEVRDVGDEAERATRETENSLELRTRDRYRKLISKIDKALKRIEDGAYGYCEETGEEIGVERLEARPIATLCLDAQERWEHRQKLMGD